MSDSPLKLAVLLSGTGRTLQNLIDRIAAGTLNAQIAVVIGSRPGLVGLQRAADAKLMNFIADRRDFATAEEHGKQIFTLCDDVNVDLVCLAGWLCLLQVPEKYAGRVMNIHPALLPSFGGKGMYGRRVHQAVLDYGCKVSGCTVHFVDAEYDSGPVILQRTCEVLDDDTPDTLAHRVFEQETIAYPEAIGLFAQRRLQIVGRRVRVISPSPGCVVPPPTAHP
ncbi:MAG: phosphoribosylglycinamide formyltransferase [Phycisphaerales bacterium]|jgi:formyltetrahydrofolate-dependent phosphoribosylglycinamide formyltransferase|nr:phosphoribosylglycinamide formyltransferase [Phycisphaerales bacterium]